MAHTMKAVAAPRREGTTLTVHVDPRTVARGHRALARGGVHASARRPTRAQSQRRWQREQRGGGK